MATYTVKKGDTLWDISKKYLGDPTRWPEIYSLNKKVIGSNPNLIYPGQVYTLPGTTSTSKPATTTTTTTKPATPTTTTTTQSQTPADIYKMLPKEENPYVQQIQDYLNTRPKWQGTTEEEMLRQAKQYASLQVDPQLQALQRSVEQAALNAENQRRSVEAAYSGVPAQIDRMLADARSYATEDAIARGVGRSGVVDYNVQQLSEPIMEQGAQAEAEKAATLAAIADTLALAQTQGLQQQQDIERQRGVLEAAGLADLQRTGHAMETEDWERGMSTLLNLASMAQQDQAQRQSAALSWAPYYMTTQQFQQQFPQQLALSWAPYYMSTEDLRQTLPLDWTQLMGQVPKFNWA